MAIKDTYPNKNVSNKLKAIKIIGILLIIVAVVYNIYLSKVQESKSKYKEQTTVKNIKEPTIKTLNNQETNKINDRSFKGMTLKNNDKGVPVLMYHSIAYEKNNEVRMPKEMFKEQMQYLKDNGYTPLTLNELYSFFINNKPVPEKSVVITLDDGYKDNYESAFPILKEFGFKATIFVITSTIDKLPTMLTSEQLKEMDKNGVEIESHTVNHEKLGELNYEAQLKTLKESKEFLDKLLGRETKYIAYPYGSNNKETPKATKEAGYLMAFTTAGRWSDKSDGIFTLDRVYISSEQNIKNFALRISNPNYPLN